MLYASEKSTNQRGPAIGEAEWTYEQILLGWGSATETKQAWLV